MQGYVPTAARGQPGPGDHALVLTFAGNDIVILPGALRPATAKAAAAAQGTLATRLSPGEKNAGANPRDGSGGTAPAFGWF